jgi:RHS repeat-associated protein
MLKKPRNHINLSSYDHLFSGIGELFVDGTCLLKVAPEAVSDNGSSHEFTYAPSGLRVRDKRTGTNAIDKRFVYTTSGALMSVHESPSKRRDIVYANGEAIAEIDQDGNVYELHNDHLGTPRYVTSRSTGKIAGEQAFGPYGEEMRGTFTGGQTLPSGYVPVTGYTGHLNEDLSGLIYMKGRYYSPLWHRFINSDQGVDPRSINQYAYVGGSPFMAKDPMGMAAVMYCTTYYYSTGGTGVEYDPETGLWTETVVVKDNSYKVCYTLDWDDWRGGWPGDYGEVGGESGGGGIGPGASQPQDKPCDPAITVDPRVGNAYKDLFTNAVNLLNSSPLTSHQRTVLGHIKGIQLGNTGVPSARLLTGTFTVNVNDFRVASVAWTASQIAHESYHMYRWNSGSFTGSPNVAEEINAVNFQLSVGRIIGLQPSYVNHLNNYKNDPAAIQRRIDAAAACR